MNGKNCLKFTLVVLAGLLLLVLLPSLFIYAQTKAKTRTAFIDVEGASRPELGRSYATNDNTPINKRSAYLRGAGPSQDCLHMLSKCMGATVRSVPREYDEIVGEADGMGWKPDNIFLLGLLLPLWDEAALPGSTFVIGPKHSADGKTWLAVNVDSEFEQASFGAVVRRKWAKHPTTMMWTLAGGPGFAGLNSSGLAVTAVWLKTDGEGIIPGVPAELVIRQALSQSDFDSALKLLTSDDTAVVTASSFALILADSKGKMAIVEHTIDAISVIRPAPNEDYLVHTNHFLDSGFAHLDAGVKVFPDSKARFKTIETALDANPKFTLDNLKALMANHDGKPNGICRHGVQKTIASILICPETGTMIVTQGNPCMNPWETFKLDDPVQKWDY